MGRVRKHQLRVTTFSLRVTRFSLRVHDAVAADSEDPASVPIYWVSKWVDYSDKYGLGYQLCDNSVGVLFNDSTRLLLLANGEYVFWPLGYTITVSSLLCWPSSHAVQAPIIVLNAT